MALVAFLALPGTAQAADITGTWHLPSGDVADQTWEITAGTGTIAGEGYGGPYTWPMEGNVSGNSVQIKTAYRELSYTAYFVGTVSSDGATMSGTWDTTSYASAESSSLTWHADRVGSGGGGPPPGGGPSGKRPTGTGVSCNYSFFNQRHTCYAQVQDTGPAPPVFPTGEVKFVTTEGGSFPMGDTCALVSSQTAPAVPSCSVEYVAPSASTYFAAVGAYYLGDSQHDPSQGATRYMSAAFPSGCNVFDNCSGTNIEVQRALDLLDGIGPINVDCGASGNASGSPRAAGLGSINLPPLVNCNGALAGLAQLVAGVNAEIGRGLSGLEFRSLINDILPTLGTDRPPTGNGLFGSLNLGSLFQGAGVGGVLGPLLQNSGIGSILNGLSDRVLSSPAFQSGMIDALFQNQFDQAAPPFPTPVTGQDSSLRSGVRASAAAKKKKAKKNAFVVGTKKFKVDSGKSKKVTLKLSKRARRFFGVLRKHGIGASFKLNLRATLVRGGVPGVAKGKRTITVRLKPKKGRGKRR